jgi:hypothetical protein
MDLSEEKVLALLERICDEQGLCMPPPERKRIAALQPLGAEAFAEEVLAAEGFDPESDSETKQRLMQLFLDAEKQ